MRWADSAIEYCGHEWQAHMRRQSKRFSQMHQGRAHSSCAQRPTLRRIPGLHADDWRHPTNDFRLAASARAESYRKSVGRSSDSRACRPWPSHRTRLLSTRVSKLKRQWPCLRSRTTSNARSQRRGRPGIGWPNGHPHRSSLFVGFLQLAASARHTNARTFERYPNSRQQGCQTNGPL